MHHIAQSPLLTGNTSMTSMKKQSGVMLLEALIAVLIFSLGILTLVALQTASIRLTGDARYRASAAIAVERLFAEMRLTELDATGLETSFGSDDGGAGYVAWTQGVVVPTLAGLLDLAKEPPKVTFDASGAVTVKLSWRTAAGETATTDSSFHSYTAATQIR